MKYVIVKKVTQRTGPTEISFAAKMIDAGQIVEFSDTIKTRRQIWGRIANAEREFICIQDGEIQYCAELEPLPNIDKLEALFRWASHRGFTYAP